METLEKIFNLTLKMKIFNIFLLCHIIRANYFIRISKGSIFNWENDL